MQGNGCITAGAVGYEAVLVRVTLAQDQHMSDLVVVLSDVPSLEPFYLTQHQTMTIDYGLAWAVAGDFNQGCIMPGVTCQGVGVGTTTIVFEVDQGKDEVFRLDGIQLEETWEPNSAVCAKAITIDLYGPGTSSIGNPSFDNPDYWSNNPNERSQKTPPIVLQVPRAEPGNTDSIEDAQRTEKNGGDVVETEGDWTVRNFPPGEGLTNLPIDANCFFEQTMDVYFTAFHLGPIPAGFAARPDA